MTQDIIHSHDRSSPTKTLIVPIPRVRNRHLKQTASTWLEEPYNHTRGEMSLWVAVITQALMDALSRANNAEALYHKNEAIHWLTSNSKDFAMVCLCAGFDPDYVRRKAKRTLVSPVAWRAEAGKGKRYLERKAYRRAKKNVKAHPCPPESTSAQDNIIIFNFANCASI